MKACLHNLDFLGTITNLRYNGYSTYRSRIGGVLTLLIFFMGLAVVLFFYKRYTSLQNYSVSQDFHVKDTDDQVPMNRKLKIAVDTFFHGQKEFRNDFLELQPYLVTKEEISMPHTLKRLNFVKCNKTEWDIDRDFEYNDLANAHCIDVDDLLLSDTLQNKNISYISIVFSIKLDRSESDKANEFNNQQIKNIINALPTVKFYFRDSYYTLHSEVSHEIKLFNYINKFSMTLSMNSIKESTLKFGQDLLIIYQDNLFGFYEKKYDVFNMNSISHMSSDRPEDVLDIYKINIYASERKVEIIVELTKLTDFISQVGGALNALLISFQLLTGFLNNIFATVSMSNLMFAKLEIEESRGRFNSLQLRFKDEKNKKVEVKQVIEEENKRNLDESNNRLNDVSNSPYAKESSKVEIYSLNQSKNLLHNSKKLNEIQIEENSLNLNQKKKSPIQEDKTKPKKLESNLKHSVLENNQRKPLAENEEPFNPRVIACKVIDTRSSVRQVIFDRKGKKIQISSTQLICIKYLGCMLFDCCCCRKTRSIKIIYNIIDDYFNRSMEITNLMKSHWDLEILKFLLFNQDQFDAFQKIPFLNGIEIIKLQQDDEMKMKIKSLLMKKMTEKSEYNLRNLQMNEKLLALTQFD